MEYWIFIGLALIAIEIFTSSFFLLFFGLGALIAACMRWLIGENLGLEVLVFGLTSFVFVGLFRKKITNTLKSNENYQNDTFLILSEDIPAGKQAQIKYQGSFWMAVNPTQENLKAGEQVRITKTDGNKLILGTKNQ